MTLEQMCEHQNKKLKCVLCAIQAHEATLKDTNRRIKELEKQLEITRETFKKYANLKVEGFDIDRCIVTLKFNSEADVRSFINRNSLDHF